MSRKASKFLILLLIFCLSFSMLSIFDVTAIIPPYTTTTIMDPIDENFAYPSESFTITGKVDSTPAVPIGTPIQIFISTETFPTTWFCDGWTTGSDGSFTRTILRSSLTPLAFNLYYYVRVYFPGYYDSQSESTWEASSSTVYRFKNFIPSRFFVFDTINTPQFVGQQFLVSIAAKNSGGDTVTSFTGTATLTCSNGVTIYPSVTGNFVAGNWEGNVEIDTPGNYYLTAAATDGTYGESIHFDVLPVSVVPEYALGALAAVFACFAALLVYKGRARILPGALRPRR